MTHFQATEPSDYIREPALRIVQQHTAFWHSPLVLTDTSDFTDAPLLGNGDLGVIVLGGIEAMTFIAGKNEFISQEEGIPKALSRLQLQIPDMQGGPMRCDKILPTQR